MQEIIDKVYIVERTSGSWDDFSRWVDKVFVNQDKANKYVTKKNLQLERLKEISREFMLTHEDIDDCIDDYIKWNRCNGILDQGSFYLKEYQITK
jgi:hypothetical protein